MIWYKILAWSDNYTDETFNTQIIYRLSTFSITDRNNVAQSLTQEVNYMGKLTTWCGWRLSVCMLIHVHVINLTYI